MDGLSNMSGPPRLLTDNAPGMEDISTMQKPGSVGSGRMDMRGVECVNIHLQQTTPSSSKWKAPLVDVHWNPRQTAAGQHPSIQLPIQRVTQRRAASAQATGLPPLPSPGRAAPPQPGSLFPPRTGLPGETRTLSPRALLKRLRGNLQVKLRYLSTRRSASLRRQGVAVPRMDFAGTRACSVRRSPGTTTTPLAGPATTWPFLRACCKLQPAGSCSRGKKQNVRVEKGKKEKNSTSDVATRKRRRKRKKKRL